MHHMHTFKDLSFAHRDLKPKNILINVEDGVKVAKIADFGMSKCILNNNNTVCIGEEYYMSPELLFENKENNSTLTDIWSAGITIYEILYK